MEDLEKQIEETKKWCISNSIISINGLINHGKTSIEIEVAENLEIFLTLGKANNIKHIVFEKIVFNSETYKNLKLESHIYNEDELQDLIEPIFDDAQKFNDRIFILTISWIKDGAVYSLPQQAHWFEKIEEKLYQTAEDFLENQRLANKDKILYSEQKQNELIKAIAMHNKYLNYSTRPLLLDRLFNDAIRNYDNDVLENELGSIKRLIKSNVEDKFELKFRKNAEMELSKSIREMIGNKRTKVDIISTLELTEGLFHKYK